MQAQEKREEIEAKTRELSEIRKGHWDNYRTKRDIMIRDYIRLLKAVRKIKIWRSWMTI